MYWTGLSIHGETFDRGRSIIKEPHMQSVAYDKYGRPVPGPRPKLSSIIRHNKYLKWLRNNLPTDIISNIDAYICFKGGFNSGMRDGEYHINDSQNDKCYSCVDYRKWT